MWCPTRFHLGAILFLLYINDLSDISPLFTSILFADDTNIFLSGSSLTDMINIMNTELTKVVDWLRANKLSLNIGKTHYMIFCSRRRNTNINSKLSINNIELECVEQTKFLGVIIDSTLKWDKHISTVKSKVSRGLGIIRKAKKTLNKTCLITLYYSMIYSYLTYCIEVWGNASNVYMDPLFKIQKKAVRIIVTAP